MWSQSCKRIQEKQICSEVNWKDWGLFIADKDFPIENNLELEDPVTFFVTSKKQQQAQIFGMTLGLRFLNNSLHCM